MMKFDRARFDAGEMPTRTRDGRKVLHVHDSGLDVAYPLMAWVEGMNVPTGYTREGRYLRFPDANRHDDLVHEPRTEKVRTVWYRGKEDHAVSSTCWPDTIAWVLNHPDWCTITDTDRLRWMAEQAQEAAR